MKKIVFLSKGPPFGIWAVCKVVFLPREVQNLKISEVPIKKSVSTCQRYTYADWELEITKLSGQTMFPAPNSSKF